MARVYLLLMLVLCLCYASSVAVDSAMPSTMFKDDILFDIQWPGGYSKDLESKQPTSGATGDVQVTPGGGSDSLLPKLSNSLLTEAEHSEQEYVQIKSVHNEDYLCELPHWSSLSTKEESEGSDEDMNSPEELIKSLKSRCTRLAMGYWVYELCHGIHVKQFHESKEPKKKPKKPGDALDEYLLGVPKSSKLKGQTSDTDTKTNSLESIQDKGTRGKIPVWLYNGNEYPYYEIQYGDGTPCDLKEGTLRSTNIKYICDINSHSTGTFLHIEEVSTCKYDAVVSIANLCQNKYYRLKEDPVYPVKCFPKEGSPTKPKSLLEHEIAMAQYTQVRQSKKSKSKGTKRGGGDKDDDETEDEKDYEMTDKSRHLPTSRTHSDYLDEGFIRSFLAGDLCLRGGTGWWQHEVCYGKHVKQVHEEVGKPPVEVYLGNWVEDGHKRWFTSSSSSKRQSKNFVIHLYMKGDMCDITGVPRQCQVKFRCSSSSRLSEVSIYLEEPTTCNYILTVEAAFLCPLLKTTDSLGMFSFPSEGIETLEKTIETKGKTQGGSEAARSKEERKLKNRGSDFTQEDDGKGNEREGKEENKLTGEDYLEEEGNNEGYGGYEGAEDLDENGNLKTDKGERKEEHSTKSEQDSNDKDRT